ncbi:hypothetical protein GPALN_005880 [Globodera pallida]|nr:hypothetical protein GPALN_005880 [Globodera pallida]
MDYYSSPDNNQQQNNNNGLSTALAPDQWPQNVVEPNVWPHFLWRSHPPGGRHNICLPIQASFPELVDLLPIQLLFSVLYLLIWLASIVGNASVLYVVSLKQVQLSSVRSVFICSLAASDILMSLTSLPITAISIFTRDWVFPSPFCKLMGIFQGGTVFVSSFTLTAIAVDRYILIRHPTKQFEVFDEFGTVFENSGTKVFDEFGTVFENSGTKVFDEFGTVFENSGTKVFDEFGTVFENSGTKVFDEFGTVFENSGTKVFDEFGTVFENSGTKVFDEFGTVFENSGTKVFDEFGTVFENSGTKVFDEFGTVFENSGTKVFDEFGTVFENSGTKVFDEFGTVFENSGTKVFDEFGTVFENSGTKVFDEFGTVFENSGTKVFDEFGTVFENSGTKVFDEFGPVFENSGTKVFDEFGTVFEKFGTMFDFDLEKIKFRTAVSIVVGVWALGYACALPIGIFSSTQVYPPFCGTFCEENWPDTDEQSGRSRIRKLYGLLVLIVQFGLPTVISSLCYWSIGRLIRRQMQKRQERQVVLLQESKDRMKSQKNRTNRMMVTMVAGLVLAWLPMNLINLWRDFNSENSANSEDAKSTEWYSLIFAACHSVAMTSAVWNPLIYSFFNPQFKETIRTSLERRRQSQAAAALLMTQQHQQQGGSAGESRRTSARSLSVFMTSSAAGANGQNGSNFLTPKRGTKNCSSKSRSVQICAIDEEEKSAILTDGEAAN